MLRTSPTLAECATQHRRLRQAVLAFPLETRAAMLHVLAAGPQERAEAIGRLYEESDGHAMEELVMDLEADRGVKADVMEALKDALASR